VISSILDIIWRIIIIIIIIIIISACMGKIAAEMLHGILWNYNVTKEA